MTKKMKKFIEESEEAKKRFEALPEEEKRKMERYLRKLGDRMQSENNVTLLKDDTEK